ncbi:MAG: leucyl aminopeptidase [Rickettsiales bacterium]|nr:leucyl aminopeptidase [Rickettsiales bacterium]
MFIKEKYTKSVKLNNLSGSIIFFSNKKSEIKNIQNLLNTSYSNLFKRNLKNNIKKKEIFSFDISYNQKIIIYSVNDNKNSFEKNGAKLYEFLKNENLTNTHIFADTINNSNNVKCIHELVHGMKLKSYSFSKYLTKKNSDVLNLNIISKKKIDLKLIKHFSAIEKGVNFTKDLVSEPGNVLHPDEYARRLMQLKKIGLKITVYNTNKLKKMKCNALLGVGQGSSRGSYIVTMEWRGNKKQKKPLAFVGKGVCFDTGGISLKPARFMEDMTYDMAGSAVVVGLLKSLALRKARVNAVGVVGLVENMVSGNAQRPGDIVKSYSGKTIEVLNTDAEGRLVLADAITFTEKKFRPNFIIDLATLTGAIVVALGSEYAGLFSNDDKLSKQLFDAGDKVDEKVWRLPLHKNYDKLMNSKNADMQNINYVGGAGSTTAAQFLQRFILNKTPWAHLDIAGMAFSKYAGSLNSSGATGYGVRLLDKFVEDNYE